MLKNKHQNLRIAFIGGGNMAFALGQGLIKEAVPSKQLLVIDPSANAQKKWLSNGISTQAKPTPALAQYDIWFFAVKPQQLYQVCQACKPYLQSNTLVEIGR